MPIPHPIYKDQFYLTHEEAEFLTELSDSNYRRVAPLLHMSDSALYLKIKGSYPMTLRDLEIICRENAITPRQVILANKG